MAQHRLFIALAPPNHVREALLDPMEGLEGARWQDFDNLHITLRFVGEVSRLQADDLALALSRVEFASFPVSIRGVGHFEKKQQPNAIWAAVLPSAPLSRLQLSIEQACQRAGLAVETRKFIPHITLARLNRSSGDISPWLARHDGLAIKPWQADGFAIFESQLTAGGAIYTQVERFTAIG